MHVEAYDERHFAGLDALWRDSFPDDAPRNLAATAIPQKLACQRDLFLVATESDAVIGSVMAGYDGHRGWISRVAVRADSRRRGVARALMLEAERRLKALGAPKINLQVVTSNAGVVPFYERLGYVVEPRISMGKVLQVASDDLEDRQHQHDLRCKADSEGQGAQHGDAEGIDQRVGET